MIDRDFTKKILKTIKSKKTNIYTLRNIRDKIDGLQLDLERKEFAKQTQLGKRRFDYALKTYFPNISKNMRETINEIIIVSTPFFRRNSYEKSSFGHYADFHQNGFYINLKKLKNKDNKYKISYSIKDKELRVIIYNKDFVEYE